MCYIIYVKKNILIILIIFLGFYSFYIEPNRLLVNNINIKDPELKGIKVVLIGDFHIKPNQQKRLEKVVSLVNKQNADVVLSVGDYVSGHEKNMTMPIENIVKELKNVKSKYGFYSVLGNHDWWLDGEDITNELNKNGIKILKNSNKKVCINGKTIYIAGVEDLTTRTPDVYSALKATHKPTILLTHSPDIFYKVPQDVNITLAGHVHGGQVRLPLFGALIVPSKYGNKYSQGLVIEEGKKMFVTKGIGNSILPVRFNCVPEIVVIEFE